MTSINMVARIILGLIETHHLVCGLILGLTPDWLPPTVTHSPRTHQISTMIPHMALHPTATEGAALMEAKDAACMMAEKAAFAAARNAASAMTGNTAFIVATNTAQEIMLTSNAAVSSFEAICMAIRGQCVVIVLIITLLIHPSLAHLPNQCLP